MAVALRIAEYARPGEVLVSQAVVDAVAAGEGGVATFTRIGPVELKGVPVPWACTRHIATAEA